MGKKQKKKKTYTIKIDWCEQKGDRRSSSDKALKITENDVQRVYNLPRGNKLINLKECTKEVVGRLKEELGLPSFVKTDKVSTTIFEKAMDMITNEEAWFKEALLYLISTLFFSQNHPEISMKYANNLKDREAILTYN
ncbi:hypothetical protein Leryth_013668 [Lithospermum erythrorhizon]|nr:hypothetical protein Leryth_013668 [Lithospermum erythrorhizon]